MAKRKLTTLGFDEELSVKLTQAGLYQCEDLFSHSALHLMSILRLSLDEIEELTRRALLACLPTPTKAIDLLSADEFVISFGHSDLDKLLHSGVKKETLTELTGPPGVGKTQMCLHLGLRCLGLSNLEKSVCVLDIEGTFSHDRLIELMHHDDYFEGLQNEIVKKIFVLKLSSNDSFTEILTSVEALCIEKDVGLLIVDSMTSLTRKEFSLDLGPQRTIALATWAAHLKKIAGLCQLAVLVTNQITTRAVNKDQDFDEQDSTNDIRLFNSSKFDVTPSLGTAWTHFVNTRIVLQFLDDEKRQLIVAKSPLCPVAAVNYRICRSGIKFEDKLCFTLAGIDTRVQRILVRPGTRDPVTQKTRIQNRNLAN